ncbi:CMGC/MAPK/ERK protein kinase [Gilbertella persicaria]|uniref:CMGC/MAPK/ERK protein kinase n=1 Tax=Gilbertella persicaria TaxID=101096 RepID=UPI00221F33A8|nr:CMGC/MAPK/ERK protein kinase [Gilbertella persicaria]KAI8084089.1 CMGC/MAPK/ERK protein kinase [Gilbertella persicaria]
MGYHAIDCCHQTFIIDEKYTLVKAIGQGAYGTVCAVLNTQNGQKCAIKKIHKLFERPILTKRALRELKLLQHFNGHKNIVRLLDMDIVDYEDFNELYLYQELMEADLHQIIRSGQPLTDEHCQSFIYQACCGLKYIHSANVLHRDLKPSNLLVNAKCELKICDFGLARGYVDSGQGDTGFMTEYVATRWYRAPEIMLSFKNYTKAIDMWSLGCIFAELLGSKPLFKGRDFVDQLNQILYILGTPDDATLNRIGSERAQTYIKSLAIFTKIPTQKLYPNASSQALDLLEKLLTLDPMARIDAHTALEHPYVELFHDPLDEPSHDISVDFSFESPTHTLEDMKAILIDEVKMFKARRHSLIIDMRGLLKRHNSISTPTMSKKMRYSEQEGYADQLVTHPSEADSNLERDLSGGVVV